MKLNKFFLASFVLAATCLASCKNEDIKEQHYDNKIYTSSSVFVDDLLIDINDKNDMTRTITPRLAQLAVQDVSVTFAAQPTLAAKYNMMYGDNAQALPAENYEIPNPTTKIVSGTAVGVGVPVNFKNIYQLDKDARYVLPVSMTDVTGIDVLESSRTTYFVFKGAALINVVADITKMYFSINWSSEVNVTSLKTITIEALVRSSNWEAGRSNALSSLFGIEGRFLIRIGDADRPRNQLQVSTSSGNWPGPNKVAGLPVDEWAHIAIVFDATTGERIYYLNGVAAYSDNSASGTISLNSGCYIGKSWDNDRWFPGEVSEVRVWNIQRTAQEIAENPYYVDPQSPGLIAYWKFSEGAGSEIKDATEKGTDLTASASVSGATVGWVPVELPPIGK